MSKSFASQLILKDVSVSFLPGQVVGVLGANGSGKTTFIKLICGLVSPDKGSIVINGLNIVSNRRIIMASLGVLLDGSRHLYWRLSAWQNFTYFSGLKGLFGDSVQQRGKTLLSLFGLWDQRNQKVESFSLGMRQKLSMCCALAHDPHIILLDEPTSGLDSDSQHLLATLLQARALEKKTILVASHDVHLLNQICDRQVVIEKGCVLE